MALPEIHSSLHSNIEIKFIFLLPVIIGKYCLVGTLFLLSALINAKNDLVLAPFRPKFISWFDVKIFESLNENVAIQNVFNTNKRSLDKILGIAYD